MGRELIKRGLFEFVLFFVLGISIPALVDTFREARNTTKLLVLTEGLIPVFSKDTAILYSRVHEPFGMIFPRRGVFYLERPFQLESGLIEVKVFAWINYQNIYDSGKFWLVLKDENILVQNNCLQIGRIFKNVHLEKIYTSKDREWNLVALKGYFPVRLTRSFTDTYEASFFSSTLLWVTTTTLTIDGATYPRHIPQPTGYFAVLIILIAVVVTLNFLQLYFRGSGRLDSRYRRVLLAIDICGFTGGIIFTYFLG